MRITIRTFLIFVNTAAVWMMILIYSTNLSEKAKHKIEDCGRLPQEADIFIDNVMWQVYQTNRGFVKLFSAHLDTRWNETSVKILANGPVISTNRMAVICQFWYEGDDTKMFVGLASGIEYIRAQCKSKAEHIFGKIM